MACRLAGPGLFPTVRGRGRKTRPGPKAPHSITATAGPSDRAVSGAPIRQAQFLGGPAALAASALIFSGLGLLTSFYFIAHSVSLGAA